MDYTSLIKEVNIPELIKALRMMRMEREDIENSLKVLSHIVDDDFVITVDEARKIIGIDGEIIEALQAEVKRLKECNDGLREKQTIIYCYGDKWQTSAKDVPKMAYEHGYLDGKYEAQPHWVSVEERLPDKAGRYLVYGDTYFTPDHNGDVDHYKNIEIGYWNDYAPKIVGRTIITHWMPIPEPPQDK